MADNGGCSCGCGEMTKITEATDPCACGCECCEAPKSKDQERTELEQLKVSIDRRLEELSA
ncbi:hypothetical protein BH20ACT2_BH20ACT2_04980 [soil metagenome]